jgi:hypothetical protein
MTIFELEINESTIKEKKIIIEDYNNTFSNKTMIMELFLCLNKPLDLASHKTLIFFVLNLKKRIK